MKINFTTRQKSIIIGSLLGDCCLSKIQGYNLNSRLNEVHSIKQYDWLLWKQNALKPLYSLLKKGETTARKNLGSGVIVNDK